MNYLRGAVSAISAPYQYYKDLAPLNPSTLTGAIDVIVVKRPAADGGYELFCSPFHVRFGKWQVLRPADKKVNISVNGRLIPFSMKIGEAGEAFFVFETESDVPEELITSPLLEPVKPGEPNDAIKTGRFGAMEDENVKDGSGKDIQEPEPLDLDAQPPTEPSPTTQETHSSGFPPSEMTTTPARPEISPSSILAFPKAVVKAVVETERDNREKVKDRAIATHNAIHNGGIKKLGESIALGQRGDEALPEVKHGDMKPAEVIYASDMVIDASGYGLHDVDDGAENASPSPSLPSASPDRTPAASRSPSPEREARHSSQGTSPINIPFPTLRATSEPPPDMDVDYVPSTPKRQHRIAPIQTASTSNVGPSKLSMSEEGYSWEWGAFPQKSPMKAHFGQSTTPAIERLNVSSKWKGQDAVLTSDEEDSEVEGSDPTFDLHRSTSMPPDVRETLRANDRRHSRDWRSYEDKAFGAGGRLTASEEDPTVLTVEVFEGGSMDFELSLVSSEAGDNWRNHEVEASRWFEKGKVDYNSFLESETIVRDPGLVIRWAGDRYITREDGSPLMDALVLWRESAIREKSASTTPTIGKSFDERQPLSLDDRASPSKTMLDTSPYPQTSSSWMSWWGRTRTMSSMTPEVSGKGGRPALRNTNSVPLQAEVVKRPKRNRGVGPQVFPADAELHPASGLASAPVGADILDSDTEQKPEKTHNTNKRFAKTLRLSSDQLKILDLKSGPNTITFSLSASGAAACTAKIFVWDHTDLVVISDIDGTITKSDALGHVFTMIGRDWTHLGVAKLYTDICRNGYKIMYLTSRAIGQADATRYYLKGIKQNDYQLPEGPVIMSPDRLLASLHREVIMRKPEVFKMACLRDIQRLFGASNPFYAGFGNRITDALSYRSVNVPSSRIFTIDSNGEVKMELLELAGYKSSYIHMTDLVDQIFPPIHRNWAPEFTDFNYWKPPVQDFPLPDLSPPSPALSARSDTSNQSTLARLRNFSLVGTRHSNNMNRFTLPPPATGTDNGRNSNDRSLSLQRMSSFERLTNAFGGISLSPSSTAGESGRSESPVSQSSTYLDSGSEDEDEDLENQKRRRRRERTRSVESMPGSLPGSVDDDIHFGSDGEDQEDQDEEEEEDGDEKTDREDEAAAEAAFDEDLLATGEMESVPFL